MIPIRDHNPSGKTAYITYSIIALNSIAFIYMFSLSSANLDNFVQTYSLIPSEITSGKNLLSLFTSMFLHGGLGHIIGNMLFLNIFGDNLEDRLGHMKYLLFYLISGLGASFLQIISNPTSTIPNLGASGAIAGIMGGYLLLFPKHKIDVLFSWGFYFKQITVPAYTMLFYWFFAQLFYGVGSLAMPMGGGIAFFAHAGGFATGYLLLKPFKNKLKPTFYPL